MTVTDLKKELVALSTAERTEVAAFLFQLRRKDDVAYQTTVRRRLNDKEPSHWLTPDEFEKQLNQN